MRKSVLGAAAVATLLAAWFAPEQDGGVVGPAAATTREAAAPAPAAVTSPPAAAQASERTTAAMAATAAPLATAGSGDAAGPDLQIHPRVADDELGNLFARQSWQAEAPKNEPPPDQLPQARQAPAQPAGAPPLPFQFMGRFVDEGKTAYFLQIDGRNVVARPGEKVDDNYLLDSAADGALHFIYLPLNQRQSLAVGDTN